MFENVFNGSYLNAMREDNVECVVDVKYTRRNFYAFQIHFLNFLRLTEIF